MNASNSRSFESIQLEKYYNRTSQRLRARGLLRTDKGRLDSLYSTQNLIENFEKKHGEPLLYKDGLGQYTHENKLIKEYICKYYCCQELKISDRTLNKAIDNNMLYNNYYFRKIGSKLKVF